MAVKNDNVQKSVTIPKEIMLLVNAIAHGEDRSPAWVLSKIISDHFKNLSDNSKAIYSDYLNKYVSYIMSLNEERKNEKLNELDMILNYEHKVRDTLK